MDHIITTAEPPMETTALFHTCFFFCHTAFAFFILETKIPVIRGFRHDETDVAIWVKMRHNTVRKARPFGISFRTYPQA